MGAFSVSGIATNVAEDAIEDGISELVHAMGNCYFGDGKQSPKCDGMVKDAFDEALHGAGQMLKFSIMSAVIYRVSQFAIVRLVAGSTMIFGYIKAGRVVNTVKRKVNDAFGGIPIVGKFLGNALTTTTAIAVGNQNERLAMANIANNNIGNVTQLIGQERQTATMQADSQRKQLMTTLGINHNAKGLSDNKKIEAYNYKMKTGSWANTVDDKKLFLSVVPRQYIKQDFTYNVAFVAKLNSFTEYARTKENDIVNLTEILAKTLATKGAL